MLFRMDPNGLPSDRIKFKEVAYPIQQIIFLFSQSPSSRVTRREVVNILILAMFRFQNLMRLKFYKCLDLCAICMEVARYFP